MLSLLWHEFYSRRADIIGWTIGLSLFALTYLGLYPSMADQMALFDLSDLAFYEALGVSDMATFEGYASGTVVNLLPIILVVYAIITGTGALAGQEDDGTLELIVTLPLPRWQIVLVKAAGIALALLAIVLLTTGSVMGIFAGIQNEITTVIELGDWVPIMLAVWPLTLAFGMFSLLLGAIAPTRRMAGVLGMVFFLVNYVGDAVTNMTTTYEAWQPLFLFHYYDNSSAVFTEGIVLGNSVVLLVVAGLFLTTAVVIFQRRDLMVGNWVWQ